MAVINCFRGIRYNQESVPDLGKVITPPYDVIDEKAQEELYQKDPFNIIRLEYGKALPGDNERHNVYSRACQDFKAWLKKSILVPEKKPSLYFYQLKYPLKEKVLTRKGFFACVRLEEFQAKVVLPHEETMSKPKEDRLNLLRACQANFSPIFALYPDPSYLLEESMDNLSGEPEIDFRDEEGKEHQVWVVEEGPVTLAIKKMLQDKQIFIADGHHRYETALEYSREVAAQKKAGYNYVMMGLVNLYNPGLVVLPTYRLVKNLEHFNPNSFLQDLSHDFSITPFPFEEGKKKEALDKLLARLKDQGEKKHVFGLYLGDRSFYLLALDNQEAMGHINPSKSRDWNNLDVSVLQVMVMEKHLHIKAAHRAQESRLTYTRDEDQALESVDSGSHQLAFFMNPTRVEEVTQVAGGGERMPQKSTYFYPKLVSGLVISRLPLEL